MINKRRPPIQKSDVAALRSKLAEVLRNSTIRVSHSMYGTLRYRGRTVETMNAAEIARALDDISSPVSISPDTPGTGAVATIVCACGRRTQSALSQPGKGKRARSCHIAFEPDGRAIPGCAATEITAKIVDRRNTTRLRPRPAFANVRLREKYLLHVPIRCSCGRTTTVGCSNLLSLPDPPTLDDAPDAAFPLGATSCWLASAPDGTRIAGCTPDERTADILYRAGRALSGDRRAMRAELEERPSRTIVFPPATERPPAATAAPSSALPRVQRASTSATERTKPHAKTKSKRTSPTAQPSLF